MRKILGAALDDVRKTLTDPGIRMTVRDERRDGSQLEVKFQGELRREQKAAADAMLRREVGVLPAADHLSRTITNEPGRGAGCTTHPAFRVTRQPSPCRVVPSSGPLTGTDSVAPSAARKTPALALRRPH